MTLLLPFIEPGIDGDQLQKSKFVGKCGFKFVVLATLAHQLFPTTHFLQLFYDKVHYLILSYSNKTTFKMNKSTENNRWSYALIQRQKRYPDWENKKSRKVEMKN